MDDLKAEYTFKGLKIRLYEEDFQHALVNHPGEVTMDKIKRCIENPDKVIDSKNGNNGCLFYEKKMGNDYFVVVVHVSGPGVGEVKTAYEATYIKSGKVLFDRESK